MSEKFGEKIEAKNSKDLEEYLKNNARLLASEKDIDKIYKKILGEMKVSTTYYNMEDIKVNLDGYNLVFTDKKGNLLHAFIVPKLIPSLVKAGNLGERKELEGKLEAIGYKIDDSEDFRNAIEKVMKKNK